LRSTRALGRRSSVADGKRKCSLREAFGVVRAPEETSAAEQTTEGTTNAGPMGAPEGGKPAPRKRRASSNGSDSSGGTRSRKSAGEEGTGVPVITGRGSGTRSGGRGRATPENEGHKKAGEMVPGKGGKMVPAETPVNMTFTVTAKERYLWTLELKRRGLTAVGVLRETMEGMVGEKRG
jgi:hypothetical protein